MKKYILLLLFLLLILPRMAFSLPIAADLTGIRTTTSQITGAGGWSDGVDNNGFEISWVITPDDPGNPTSYNYAYTISGVGEANLSKALSHWILEVTYPALSTDFSNVTPGFSSDSPKEFEPGSDNPNMPGDLYGIKWNTTGDPTAYTVSFDTFRDPVWGDFYAKDGQDGGVWTVAYNRLFGENPDESTTDFSGWIATPNGGSAAVPEPATMLLLGSGLIGLAGVGRRKFFKKI